MLYNSTFSGPAVRADQAVKVVARGNIRAQYTDMPINLLRARGINSLCLQTERRKSGARDLLLRFSHQRSKKTILDLVYRLVSSNGPLSGNLSRIEW